MSFLPSGVWPRELDDRQPRAWDVRGPGRMTSAVFGSLVVEVSVFGCLRSGRAIRRALGIEGVVGLRNDDAGGFGWSVFRASRFAVTGGSPDCDDDGLGSVRRRSGAEAQPVLGLVVSKSRTRGVAGSEPEMSNGSVRLETPEVFGPRELRSVPGFCAECLRV